MIQLAPASQRDPRWRAIRLGFGDEQTTLGSDGCLITSLAMLAGAYGLFETPATLNEKLIALGKNAGFFGALFIWEAMPRVLPGLSARRRVDCRLVPAPLGEIDAELTAGRPVLIEVDMAPSPQVDTHWVVVTGKQGDDYLISDPWPVDPQPGTSLMAGYGFGRRTPDRIITYVVEIDGPMSTGGASGNSADAPVRVIVADDPDVRAIGGLRLREKPVSGSQKRLLPVGTILTTLEAPAIVSARIGQQNAWLQVLTEDGLSGFVAAWYVRAAPAERAAAPDLRPETAPPLRRNAGLQGLVGRRGAILRPAPHGRVIARLVPGDRLQIIDAPKSALAAVGRRGEWIAVRVLSGAARGQKGVAHATAIHLR
jgi:hypothetical protein